VKVHPPGYPYEQIRQYSLSAALNGRYYRITVQRELAPADQDGTPDGLISNYLHASLNEGDQLALHMPGGDFTLKDGDAPVALVSGGAGITCMLQQLAATADDNSEVLFLHGARGRDRHAFGREVQELVQKRPGITAKVLYEQAGPEDRLGEHYHAVGRINSEVLKDAAEAGAEFYFCGPPGFMAAMESTLDQLQVPVKRRHSEVFGPDPSFVLGEVPDLHGE
jgi:nitric oxide dioxygenase